MYEHFGEWKLTFKQSINSFQFVTSISTEVYQIVDQIKGKVVPPGLSLAERLAAERKFGQDLVWFVWSAVEPIKGFKWLPFKKTIEKRIVMWLAGMGLDTAKKFFNTNKEVSTFKAKDTTTGIIKGF